MFSDAGTADATAGEPVCPNHEASYEALWRADFITGGAAHGTVPQSVASDDNILDEVDAARPSLTSEQLRMVDNPEEHLNIIRIWCQTPWIVKHWPSMQAFVDRNTTRDAFRSFWGNLRTHTEGRDAELRIRSVLNPLAGIPLRVLPNTPLHQLNDTEITWIMLDRLGMQHPEAIGLAKCNCRHKTEVGTGRHSMRCGKGGGPSFVHDSVVEAIAAMHRNAGVVTTVEAHGLIPGSDTRPADILAHGIGKQGRDVAIDVAIVDSRSVSDNSLAMKCAMSTGIKARTREADKRDKRDGEGSPSMEERLNNNGYECTPLVYEVDGAATGTWAKYIKKLSETAFTRRGHDQKYFEARWKTTIAMTLAKRGAQAGIRRTQTLQGERSGGNRYGNNATATDGLGDGPLGAFGVESPQVMGIDATAAPTYIRRHAV